MTTIEKLLLERGQTHGDYEQFATISQLLKDVIHGSPNWKKLTFVQCESLDMLCHKMARVVTGNPNHRDHWDDMQGYAKLAGDRVKP